MKIKTYNDYLKALVESPTELFWYVPGDVTVLDTFKFDLYFTPDNEYDRKINHVLKNRDWYDGIMLLSKYSPITEKEFNHRFPVNRKEWDIVASTPKLYDIFVIDTYEEYLTALETTTTEMFWMTSKNIEPVDSFKFELYFSHHNRYDRTQNHAFIHEEDGKKTYDGIFLLSKAVPLTKKEIEHRFPVDRKEWDIVASKPKLYDIFIIDSYDEYLYALENSTTEMFWMTSKNIEPVDSFKFDLYFSKKNNEYDFDRTCNHAFLHTEHNIQTYDGILLCSKAVPMSKKEVERRFPIHRKEWNIIASKLKNYDIVFISYNEPNADANYEILKSTHPTVKRVHGVKGIHNAHIEASKLVETNMFWVVDGDAIVEDGFNFDFLALRYEQDIVYTWRSKNPMNGLTYGYGGVKLLPTKLTLNMNTSTTDMTTAISNKFRVVNEVSNITAFNTDPFNTWKSAFRECVKLASKTIQGQVDAETEDRLHTWCTVATGDFAIHALRGARAGKIYGEENAANSAALSKINDFEWLEQEFKRTSVLR